jgi:hypothetical protein
MSIFGLGCVNAGRTGAICLMQNAGELVMRKAPAGYNALALNGASASLISGSMPLQRR